MGVDGVDPAQGPDTPEKRQADTVKQQRRHGHPEFGNRQEPRVMHL
jgi:hypothetical protein